jgi:regulatory protein
VWKSPQNPCDNNPDESKTDTTQTGETTMIGKKKIPTQRNIPLTPDEILLKMENFCAYRERCPKEVRSKLQELGADRDIAKQIFKSLQADKFFEEERFAMAFAGGKFRNNQWGKVRIRLELRMRDISSDIQERALEAIDIDIYEAVLIKLLQKKLLQYAGDEKAREKAAASLIRTGYEPDLVFKNLNKI